MEAVGNLSSELDERRRPGNEDFCCQAEEQTKRTMETRPSEVGKRRTRIKTGEYVGRGECPTDFIISKGCEREWEVQRGEMSRKRFLILWHIVDA